MKDLTRNELLDYIKINGITKVVVLGKYMNLSKNATLFIGICNGHLSSYNSDTDNKNLEFNYSFDYKYNFNSYEEKFRITSAKSKYKPKPDDLVRYMVYATGCGNSSGIMATLPELKDYLTKATANSDWTGRIIGYKMIPILEAATKVTMIALKAPTTTKRGRPKKK